MKDSKHTSNLHEAVAAFKKFVCELHQEIAESKEPDFDNLPLVIFENLHLTGKTAQRFVVLSNQVYGAVSGREHLSRGAADLILQKSIASALDTTKTSSLDFEARVSEEAQRGATGSTIGVGMPRSRGRF
jgi:hypothetical protein